MRTKHNKKLCRDCKYRGTIGSRTITGVDIVCDYASTSDEHRTCLTYVNGKVIDRRATLTKSAC